MKETKKDYKEEIKRLNKKKNTKITTEGDKVVVKYHYTDIVIFDNKEIQLDTGGFFTVSTKRRLNEVSSAFNLGYHVFQKDFTFYVSFKGVIIELLYHITLLR